MGERDKKSNPDRKKPVLRSIFRMANIQISDLHPVEGNLSIISLTNKELSVVSGGNLFRDFLRWWGEGLGGFESFD